MNFNNKRTRRIIAIIIMIVIVAMVATSIIPAVMVKRQDEMQPGRIGGSVWRHGKGA